MKRTRSTKPRLEEPKKKKKKKTREESSLRVITEKFIKLFDKENEENCKEVDLNESCRLLGVQKRRLYDITNVLEGVGLIEKISKSTIKWIGEEEEKDEDEKNKIIDKISSIEQEIIEIEKKILKEQNELAIMRNTNEDFSFVCTKEFEKISDFNEKLFFLVKNAGVLEKQSDKQLTLITLNNKELHPLILNGPDLKKMTYQEDDDIIEDDEEIDEDNEGYNEKISSYNDIESNNEEKRTRSSEIIGSEFYGEIAYPITPISKRLFGMQFDETNIPTPKQIGDIKKINIDENVNCFSPNTEIYYEIPFLTAMNEDEGLTDLFEKKV